MRSKSAISDWPACWAPISPATTAAATIAYAAPECLDPGNPSSNTDQYSLAISYYEMHNGVLPYATETLTAIMEAKKTGRLDFSASPAEEQKILHRATSPDPADRYPSSSAMVEALRQVARGGLADTTFPNPSASAMVGALRQSAPGGLAETTVTGAPAKPSRLAAAALLVVLVAAGAALWKFNPWSSVERKPQAVKTVRDSGERKTAEATPGSLGSGIAEPAKTGSAEFGGIPQPKKNPRSRPSRRRRPTTSWHGPPNSCGIESTTTPRRAHRGHPTGSARRPDLQPARDGPVHAGPLPGCRQ